MADQKVRPGRWRSTRIPNMETGRSRRGKNRTAKNANCGEESSRLTLCRSGPLPNSPIEMSTNKQPRRLFGFLALTSILFHVTSNAATLDCTIEPRPEDAFEKAHYRMWIPEATPELRGIVFRQHGCGPGARKFGLEHANDIQWQALAQKHSFALMSSQLWAPEEDCSTWTMPEDGSANAFLNAIQQFAAASEHP